MTPAPPHPRQPFPPPNAASHVPNGVAEPAFGVTELRQVERGYGRTVGDTQPSWGVQPEPSIGALRRAASATPNRQICTHFPRALFSRSSARERNSVR
jgi:hypothetical protein